MNPKVSIIIPNYNHIHFLKQRLDSVFNQAFQDFEVILFENAQTVCVFHGRNTRLYKSKNHRILNTIKAFELVIESNNIVRCTKNELKIKNKKLRKKLTVNESKLEAVLKRIKMKFS